MSRTKEMLVDAIRLYAKYGNEDKKNRLFIRFIEEACENFSSFDRLYDELVDQESRDVLSWALRFRAVAFFSESRDQAHKIVPSQITRHRWDHMLEVVKERPEAQFEKNLDVDLIENFVLDGYNLPGICEVGPADTVLDLGAFNGNSAIALGRHCSKGQVYAFEPNPTIREYLERNIKNSTLKNIQIVPCGVAKQNSKIKFKRDGAASRPDPNGDVEVEVVSIDSWVEEMGIKSVDFMKFDIEGFEQPALHGAAQTIRHFRPKMAISIYHLFNDFTKIPRIVQDYGGWYKFYLRHNAIGGGEIVLFGQPAYSGPEV